MDANCHAGQIRSINESGEGPLPAIPNHADVRIDLLGRSYRFNLGGDHVRVGFSPFTP